LEFNVPFQHKYGYIRDDLLSVKLSGTNMNRITCKTKKTAKHASITVSYDITHAETSKQTTQVFDLYFNFRRQVCCLHRSHRQTFSPEHLALPLQMPARLTQHITISSHNQM